MSANGSRSPESSAHRSASDTRDKRDIRILSTNLEDIHTRICSMLSCDHIHTEALAELYARAYVRPTETAVDALSSFSDASIDPQHIAAFYEQHAAPIAVAAENVLPHDTPLLDELCKQMTTVEQICFCRALISDDAVSSQAPAARLLGQSDPLDSAARGRVIYQHNIYTDEAFLHFSRVLPTAKACYADNFDGVCKQVFDGQCEYCILPLENTQDGKLIRFYGLIEKYELKISLTCKVTNSDKRHSTVFGLCRRGIAPPLLHDRSVCFEFVFWQEPGHLSLSELLCAAECASLSLLRADCLPRSDDEIVIGAGYPFDLCFELTAQKPPRPSSVDHDFLAFLLFLSIHAPNHLPLGIYQNI